MDALGIVSVDDSPWPFNQLAVDRDVHRSQLGDEPAAFRQRGKRLAATLHSHENRESIAGFSSAMNSTIRSRSSLAASVHRTS